MVQIHFGPMEGQGRHQTVPEKIHSIFPNIICCVHLFTKSVNATQKKEVYKTSLLLGRIHTFFFSIQYFMRLSTKSSILLKGMHSTKIDFILLFSTNSFSLFSTFLLNAECLYYLVSTVNTVFFSFCDPDQSILGYQFQCLRSKQYF